MSQFVVSARKYRPARFEDVVGQEHVSNTLKNALQTGHLAHAFLFCGPRGVGKTTCARILAKVINCQNIGADHEPCNTCDSCRAFNENASFNITELDAASNNTVDAMRALIDQVRFQPQQGKYKVFIIDEVHMLSASAFNAFLKTLEEPPPYAIFILATTEKHKILPTILSRCQIYDFRRITVQDTVKHLQHICAQEGIAADEEALHVIGQKADGALRDALSIFDRMVAAGGNQVRYAAVLENLNVLDYDYYFRVVDCLLSEDMSSLLLLFDEVCRKGFDPDIFILGLAEHIRNLLVCKDEATLGLLEAGESLRDRYRNQAQLAPAALLISALNLANECDLNYKMARNKRLHTEMALIKMTYIQRAVRRTPFTGTEENPEKKTPDLRVETAAQVAVSSEPATNPVQSPIPPVQPTIHSQPTTDNPPTYAKASAGNTENPQPTTHNSQPPGETNNHAHSVASEQRSTSNAPIVAEPQPEPAQTAPEKNTLRTTGKYGMVKLNSLDAMLQDHLHTEESATEAQAPPFDLSELRSAWNAITDRLPTETIKPFLRQVELEIEAEHITAKVGSPIAESTVRQERGIIEHLRAHFRKPGLTLSVKLERKDNGEDQAPLRAAPLSDREKLQLMQQSNSNLRALWERFGLTLEGEG